MKNVHCLDSRLGHRLPKHMIQDASSTDIFGVFDSNLKAFFREGNASNDQEIWLNMKESWSKRYLGWVMFFYDFQPYFTGGWTETPEV